MIPESYRNSNFLEKNIEFHGEIYDNVEFGRHPPP